MQIGMSVKNQNRMANSVDPAETAYDEPSHEDQHFLHRYLVWSVVLKGLGLKEPSKFIADGTLILILLFSLKK